MPTVRSARQDVLSDEEIQQLTRVCRGIKDELVVVVPLYAGLRVGELAHLSIGWLNWQESTIDIPQRQVCFCWDCRHYRHSTWEPKYTGVASIIPSASFILR